MGLLITLAGQVSVSAPSSGRVDGIPLTGSHSRVAFGLLVLERHGVVGADKLAAALWASREPNSWRPALRNTISAVRRALGSSPLLSGTALLHRDGGYQLCLPLGTEVDVEQAMAALTRAERCAPDDPVGATRDAAAARKVMSAEFLPGGRGTWVEDRRERFGSALFRALEVECAAALRSGQYATAVTAAYGAVALDPFRESAQILLVRSTAAAGDPAAAQRAYQRYCTALADELGMPPSAALRDAYLAVVQADSGATHVGPHSDAIASCRASLDALDPADPSSAAARHTLLMQLSTALFHSGSKRLATRACLDAAQAARDAGSAEGVAAAALGLGSVYPLWVDDDARTAVRLLEEALAGLDDRSASLRARVQSRLAGWSTWSAPRSTCLRLAADAESRVREVADPAALAAVLLDRGLMPPRRPEDVRAAFHAGRELTGDLADQLNPVLLFVATGWIGDGLLAGGDVTAVDRMLPRMTELASRLASRFRWRIVATRAMLATLRGELGAAEALADEALTIGRGQGDTGVEGVHTSQLLVIRWLQGRVGEMVTATEHFASLASAIDWDDVLAWVYAESGQTAAARRLLAGADPARFDSDQPATPWVHWASSLSAYAHAAVLVGDPGQADHAYRIAARMEASLMTTSTVCCFGSREHVLAELATAAGHHARALEHRRRAITEYRILGASAWIRRLTADVPDPTFSRTVTAADASCRALGPISLT